MSSTSCPAAKSSSRATRRWLCSSKKMVTTPSSTKQREDVMGKVVSLDNLLASMEARRQDLGNRAAPWLGSLLDESRVNFASAGLPNRRVEAWRYSDLAKALHESVPASSDAMAPPVLPGAAIVAFE